MKKRNQKIVSFERYVKTKKQKALLKAWTPNKEDLSLFTTGLFFILELYILYVLFVALASIMA